MVGVVGRVDGAEGVGGVDGVMGEGSTGVGGASADGADGSMGAGSVVPPRMAAMDGVVVAWLGGGWGVVGAAVAVQEAVGFSTGCNLARFRGCACEGSNNRFTVRARTVPTVWTASTRFSRSLRCSRWCVVVVVEVTERVGRVVWFGG